MIATRERYQAFRDGAEWQDVCGPCYPVRYFLGEREAFYAQPLADRLRSVSAVLILDGQECEYASYADARSAALALIGSPFLRAQWQAGKGEM